VSEFEPLQVPIRTAARMLGCCRQTLYKMRADKQIVFGRMRGRTMVPMAEIKRVHALIYPPAPEVTPEPVVEPVGEPKKERIKKRLLIPQVSAL
jgi:hypothetical protein